VDYQSEEYRDAIDNLHAAVERQVEALDHGTPLHDLRKNDEALIESLADFMLVRQD
jgi:hypothetical protein